MKTTSSKKLVSILFVALLFAALTFAMMQVAQADYDPSSGRLILTDEGEWWSHVFQRKMFYSEGLWWFIYCNTSAQVYRTYTEATDTLSGPQLFRNDSNHSYDCDISLDPDGKSFHYGFYKGVKSQPLYYRKGQFNSNGSVTWLADEQTVLEAQTNWWYENPGIGVDSYGYPFITYFAIWNPGLSPNTRVIKSSTNNGVWTTDTGFPKNLSIIEIESRAAAVRMTNGKMMMVYTHDKTAVCARLWNGTVLGEQTEIATGDISKGAFSCTSIDDNVYVVFHDCDRYEYNWTAYNGTSWSDSESLTPLRDPVNDWLNDQYGNIASDPINNEVYFTYIYGAYPVDTEYYTLETKVFRNNQWEDYIVWDNVTVELNHVYMNNHRRDGRVGVLYEDADNNKVYFQMINGYDSKTHSDYNAELQANSDPYLKNFDGIIQELNYSNTGILNFSVWMPSSEISKGEVYCTLGEPVNVTGTSWGYNSTTKICNITATHESTVNITVDWRRFVYVHVLDAGNSSEIEGASVYLTTPLWTSENATTNSTGWALCYATAYGTFTVHVSKLAYSSNSTSFVIENVTQTETIQLTAGLYNPWFDQRLYIGAVVAATGGAIIAYIYRRQKKTRSGSTP